MTTFDGITRLGSAVSRARHVGRGGEC